MRLFLTVFLLLTSNWLFSQDIKTSEFFDQIVRYDVSDLWTLDEFEIGIEGETMGKSEPYGFIGDNYQRLFVHIISAIKNPKNELEYFIFGKTKVKTNICSFQGKIKVTNSRTYDQGDVPELKQGFFTGEYEFYEDPDEKGTGIFKGVFRTNFIIDTNGNFKYNGLNFDADGFENNQFEGTWTNYKSNKSKKCNWGDYRIPDSNELDCGAGEFSPGEKFEDYGWKNYSLAWGYNEETLETKEARKREEEKWWIEK